MRDGFESACTADSRQHRLRHALCKVPSYLDMGNVKPPSDFGTMEYEQFPYYL